MQTESSERGLMQEKEICIAVAKPEREKINPSLFVPKEHENEATILSPIKRPLFYQVSVFKGVHFFVFSPGTATLG